MISTDLACPLDGLELTYQDRQMRCASGHTYDIAKQGYINLLPVQYKKSKQPGDSKEMVEARSRFLDTGIYDAISDELNNLVIEYVSQCPECSIVDAGCGEGFYADRLYRYLVNKNSITSCSFIGVDISKQAIIAATKRNKNISWVVGTNSKIPVVANSSDIIVCMFGFPCFDEFKRTLKPGGIIVLVDPGKDHLKELREIIYTDIHENTDTNNNQIEIPGFQINNEETLRFETNKLNNGQIQDLLVMTPHIHRASKQGRKVAMQLDSLSVTIDVTFRVLVSG